MDPSTLLALSREALWLVCLLSAPPILSSLCIGLLMGFLQATTQVQETTLSLVPKLAAAMLSLAVAGPWIGQQLSHFATQLFLALSQVAT